MHVRAVWVDTGRYRVTKIGQRVALCYCRIHCRTLAPALSAVLDKTLPNELATIVEQFDQQIDRLWCGQSMHARSAKQAKT